MKVKSAKKFGTFAGVFTPSILTILGVIMYLRLPYITGVAGLWMTLGIITVAHIISVTTGLSVSSIATDKKIKAGGIYYIISRSLGLPIGGTLGLVLFIGMSFGTSLYLIGFAESFLEFLGAPASLNNIRITAGVALVVVTLIVLISTSFALKSQYLILFTIVLSILSILFWGLHSPVNQPIHLSPLNSDVNFEHLFGIFFPAVTGFTAGVSMSGDLQDPKKSIPLGTIAAILAGFVIYCTLAVFFTIYVPANDLANDSNILARISASAPVLRAGIWGATISSALGSVLGAPRILQAISKDHILPDIFSRGTGPANEPRIALIVTLSICLTGILIGELDIIARIVSIFFIMSYGFINISCAIESWVSPDFRPDFPIPKTVAWFGAITCLVVMIQLDLIAMIAAIIIMAGIYLYLKRKEVVLKDGDTSEGLWASIVLYGLNILNKSHVHQRNWRPNMILFSGGADERPELVALATALINKKGIVSNFDLKETSKARFQPRHKEAILSKDNSFDGVFSRQVECQDIYETMAQIARYYGISGAEPNTVLLGHARSLRNANRFAGLITNFSDLDYNVLLFDQTKTKNLENNQLVDIWWSGQGNNLSLIFALLRFLESADNWREAEHRFLAITHKQSQLAHLQHTLEMEIAKTRIPGSVRVIYNPQNKKSFQDIIVEESRYADLVMLGMPNFNREDPQIAVKRMNDFAKGLQHVLWVRASSYFSDVKIKKLL